MTKLLHSFILALSVMTAEFEHQKKPRQPMAKRGFIFTITN